MITGISFRQDRFGESRNPSETDPLTGATRWSAPAASTLAEHGASQSDGAPQAVVSFLLHQNSSKDDPAAFLIHAACWQLTECYYQPRQPPLSRLIDCCIALPWSSFFEAPDWNHGNGGLGIKNQVHIYPWQDRYSLRPADVPGQSIFVASLHSPDLTEPSPANLLSKEELLDKLKLDEVDPAILDHTNYSNQTGRCDCFSSLPWELCEEIACHLSTRDVSELRLAARSFRAVYYSTRFWKTRFDRDAELGYFPIVGANDWPSAYWRQLYRAMRRQERSPGFVMKNRKRVWNLLKTNRTVLDAKWAERGASYQVESDDHAVGSLLHVLMIREEEPIIRASGLHRPRHVSESRMLTVPDDLESIEFSTIYLASTEYIAGIRLLSRDGSDCYAGYDVKHRPYRVPCQAIYGFVLALDGKGIRALKVVGQGGSQTAWLGDAEDCLVTNRLKALSKVNQLLLGFDVSLPSGIRHVHLMGATFLIAQQAFKLCNVTVKTASTETDGGTRMAASLRDYVLWFQSPPPPELNLKDSIFSSELCPSDLFLPQYWCQFGGSGGSLLDKLTTVSIQSPSYWPTNISFSYSGQTSFPSRSFGRMHPDWQSRVKRLEIDGAGGERIISVSVRVSSDSSLAGDVIYRPRRFEYIKITTNKGRSVEFAVFEPARLPSSNTRRIATKVWTAESTEAITGFYGNLDFTSEHSNFGVMTERLDA